MLITSQGNDSRKTVGNAFPNALPNAPRLRSFHIGSILFHLSFLFRSDFLRNEQILALPKCRMIYSLSVGASCFVGGSTRFTLSYEGRENKVVS